MALELIAAHGFRNAFDSDSLLMQTHVASSEILTGCVPKGFDLAGVMAEGSSDLG